MGARLLLTALLALAAVPASMTHALELEIPGNARMTKDIRKAKGTYFLPLAPFANDKLPTVELEGQVIQQAWRIEAQDLTSLQIIAPLRDQLMETGYEILLDCVARECGGFDFRFNTSVMPAPDMFVDLFDYRFLSARLATSDAAPRYASILVSRSGISGYVQITTVLPEGAAAPKVAAGNPVIRPATPADNLPLARALSEQGHVILADLTFETGSAALGNGDFASLAALAAFLKADPGRRVALVGHTDTVGGLEPNVALSRRRAASVLERLVSAYDIPRGQLESGGMGYLSPVAPNTTPEGREANRRVEAVLLDTE